MENLIKKMKYYCDWYLQMDESEKRSDVGKWIRTNIERYSMAIESTLNHSA
jgi:hypothetical protein